MGIILKHPSSYFRVNIVKIEYKFGKLYTSLRNGNKG